MVNQGERRIHPRYPIDWPVSLRPPERARVFGGRGQDLSRGGALVALPLSIPLRLGQRFEMKLHPRANPLTPTDSPERPSETRTARVVRVERGRRLLDGLQLVGLAFEG